MWRMIRMAIGAASRLLEPRSTKTVTTTFGSSTGAKPVNQPCVGSSPFGFVLWPYSAVPVLPAIAQPRDPVVAQELAAEAQLHALDGGLDVALVDVEGAHDVRRGGAEDVAVRIHDLAHHAGRSTLPMLAMAIVMFWTWSGLDSTYP